MYTRIFAHWWRHRHRHVVSFQLCGLYTEVSGTLVHILLQRMYLIYFYLLIFSHTILSLYTLLLALILSLCVCMYIFIHLYPLYYEAFIKHCSYKSLKLSLFFSEHLQQLSYVYPSSFISSYSFQVNVL